MSHKIEDLRETLFATLADLRDKTTPLDLERARVIAEVAQVIVNSAKVEVDMVKATGKPSGSSFFPELAPPTGVPRIVKPMGE